MCLCEGMGYVPAGAQRKQAAFAAAFCGSSEEYLALLSPCFATSVFPGARRVMGMKASGCGNTGGGRGCCPPTQPCLGLSSFSGHLSCDGLK